MAVDPLHLNTAIQTLRRYSLIKRNRETNTLSLHRLVQAVMQDMMSSDEQRVWAEQAVRAVSEVFPFVDPGTWRNAQPYLPHADMCVSLLDQYQFSFPEAARLLDAYGRYLQYTAQYEQAEPLYQRALHICEQSLGPEHPNTGNTLRALATLYQDQGRHQEAEPLYQRALHIHKQKLGSEHPYTGNTLRALATIYQDQGRHQEAEPLYQRALRIKEQSLGPEHPSTGSTLHQLASLYQEQGKYEQAEPLQIRARAIRAKQEHG